MSIVLDGTTGLSSPGLYAPSAFSGTYGDGIVVDYVTGNGRVTVGSTDGIIFYNGGTSSRNQIASLDVGGSLNVPNTFGFKNRIINGAMVIDQRNAGASVTVTSATYAVDRFSAAEDTDGTLSAQQVSDAPAGFNKSIKFTVGTADASLGATQYAYFRQAIEGYNFADMGFGAAGAATITVSFWVKASVTGLYSGNIASSNHDRCYAFSYTVLAANTWEQKTATITGDTTGTWLTTNGVGAYLHFCLASGSTYLQSSTGVWQAGTYLGATGQTNLMATSGNIFQVTGVQLEKGSTATSFDYRPYGTELALCQRYFQKVGDGGNPYAVLGVGRFGSATAASLRFPWSVVMRATPTASFNTATYQLTDGTTARSVGAISIYSAGTDGCEGDIVTSSATNGNMTQLRGNAASPNAPYINLSAEL